MDQADSLRLTFIGKNPFKISNAYKVVFNEEKVKHKTNTFMAKRWKLGKVSFSGEPMSGLTKLKTNGVRP